MQKKICFFLLMAAAMLLPALELKNNCGTIHHENGKITVFAKDSQTPILTLTPAFAKGATIREMLVTKETRGQKIHSLSLRGANQSLAIKLEEKDLAFTISLNRKASPVQVKWNAEAVVLPDLFGEDIILEAGKQVRRLPGALPCYMALLAGGNATVAVIPILAEQDAILSADLRTLTLNQQSTEEYMFVIKTARGVWHKTTMPQQEKGASKLVTDWTMPFQARWQLSTPFQKGYIPLSDGLRTNWDILCVNSNGSFWNRQPRTAITDKKTKYTWLGGFEGMFTFPAFIQNGKLTINHPAFTYKSPYHFDEQAPVYIYAWRRGDGAPAQKQMMPENYIPGYKRQIVYSSQNVGIRTTTCATTADFEKIFYKDDSEDKYTELVQMLAYMQHFVDYVRARADHAFLWKNALLKFAAKEQRATPALQKDVAQLRQYLQNVDIQFEDLRKRIKTPEDCEKLSQQVLVLAKSQLDSEAKEKQSKVLGGKIREIGGGQDNLIARMHHIQKCVRNHAILNYTTAKSEEAREFWFQIYQRTEIALQSTEAHEGK